MPRIRKGPNRYWSKDEKLRIIRRVVDDGISSAQVSREEDISNGMLSSWIKKYITEGEDALNNNKKPMNPLSKYSNKKVLSELEKLEFENMKLKIENERLKKGYMMKGDGSFVMYKK